MTAREWSVSGIMRRLLSPSGLADPYAVYREVRAAADTGRLGRLAGRLLFRHADVRAALEDRELSADRVSAILRPLGADQAPVGALELTLRDIIAFKDPPDHRRLRLLLTQAFTPRMVAAARPRIEAMTDDLLDRLAAGADDNVADLHAELSYPLPAMVISALLGIPEADRTEFQAWARDLVYVVGSGTLTPEHARSAAARAERMRELLASLVAERAGAGFGLGAGDDLLGAMIVAVDDGRGLSADELYANAMFLMTAGHETATNMLSNSILCLLRHRTQLDLLRAEPALVGAAVEETLRYESPVQMAARIADRDRELGGLGVRAGDSIILMLGAANRDPEVYRDPDMFDITREPGPHLAFSHGAHFCLGAALARAEARVVLPRLLDRFPALRLTGAPIEWQPTIDFRGPVRLPVELR